MHVYCDWIDLPMVTGGMTGSVEEGLALTGMGVVGPFTITWPDRENRKKQVRSMYPTSCHLFS